MNAINERFFDFENQEYHDFKTRDDDFPFSAEVQRDLQEIVEEKDLIGSFEDEDELFKSLGI